MLRLQPCPVCGWAPEVEPNVTYDAGHSHANGPDGVVRFGRANDPRLDVPPTRAP